MAGHKGFACDSERISNMEFVVSHYGLVVKLRVGTVTTMYKIVERITGASLLVRP